MDFAQRNLELKTIYEEYRSFFPQIDLKLTSGLLSNLNDGILSNRMSHLKLVTGESQTFKISVDLKGWFVVGQETSYETFETLMMKISPWFGSKFGDELSRKLQSLQD